MRWLLTLDLVTLVLVVVDCCCYALARYPERKAYFWIPFVGGPLALYRLGRNKKS